MLNILLVLECVERRGREASMNLLVLVRDNHHWLQVTVFKPFLSFMQTVRRREGVFVSEEI